MSARSAFWTLRGGELVFALLVFLLLRGSGDPAVSQSGALAAGLAAAAVLYAVLVGGLPVRAFTQRRWPALAAKSAVLVVRAATEEVVWRLAVAAAIAAAAGWPVGLALSTAGFAAAHGRRSRRLVATHAATGLAFGALFFATGRLLAPIVAHAAYNVLVLLAAESRRNHPP